MASLPPAKWYPDPERAGQWRYWDGTAWTAHRAPMRISPSPAPVRGYTREAPRANWFARHRAVLSILVILVLVGFMVDRLNDEQTGPASSEPPDDGSASGTDPYPREEPADGENAPTTPKQRVRRYTVLQVVDGDTVELDYKGGTTVRVIGIDTPETVSPSVPDECGGQAATATARTLLQGKSVAIRFDPSQGRRDNYGRLLAYLTVPGVGDYGMAMLKRGRAAEDTYDAAYQMQDRYQAVEALAKQADRNMWGKCGGPDKPLPLLSPEREPQTDCASGYSPCLPAYPPDLDCADVAGPITVTGGDPHGLDREDDGIACE